MHITTHGRPTITQQLTGFARQTQRRSVALVTSYSRPVAGGAVLATALIVAVQLWYPSTRALPFTKISGTSVSLKSAEQLSKTLDAMSNQPVSIRAVHHKYDITPAQIGLTYDHAATAERAGHYPVKARLVPGSILFYGQRKQTEPVLVPRVDQAKLRTFAEKLAQENSRPPQEGAVYIEQGKIVTRPAQTGTTYDVAAVMSELQKPLGQSFTVPANITQPVVGQSALQAAQTQAKQYVAKPLILKITDKPQTIGTETVLAWLRFTPDAATRQVKVLIDPVAVKATVSSFTHVGYIAPTTATVTHLDGREVARSGGSEGQALNVDATVTAVAKALEANKPEAVAVMGKVEANNRVIRTYSSTSVGLQALLNDWLGSHRGPRWGIVIKELGGTQRTASVRAGEQFVTASVYKPFVAMTAQSKIESGEVDPNTPTSTGQSLNTCIEQMIVHSDNGCAHAVGDLMGWETATAFIQARGFASTSVAAQYNFYTTPNDTTAFLERLAEGSLMGATQNARLLDMMRRQIYRNGIPTGSRGAPVANKVGYTDGYRHDIGIVYHPKGSYVLSILSYGGTYPSIVDLARTVYDYFSQ